MGQVRCYDLIGPDLEHAANIDARRPRPIGLTVDQVQSTGRRQEAREPVPVTAWVPHRVVYDEAQLIDAEAIAWTEGAVLIRWTPAHTTHPSHLWVYAAAVRRR
ncbi:hypothetical protein AB1K54_16970 [Microbacterium sp. BWT-B31]|uniref:hypothetical protein n=1 Tax=Microbacterium sp. BWT-B31 TaxID=3232072 RepID=UPI0035278DFA